MVKSADAFRTISEVADDLDISQHVLRFWETKFPQIKPLKRGGGRRYYRPEDVELLRAVQRLLYGERYTIRGVQQILRSKGARAVSGMMAEGKWPSPSHILDQSKGPGGYEDDRQTDMEQRQTRITEPLPDDFFDRPVPNPIVGVERWRLATLVEELRACAKILSAAQSRHTDGVLSRNAPPAVAAGHSVDAP